MIPRRDFFRTAGTTVGAFFLPLRPDPARGGPALPLVPVADSRAVAAQVRPLLAAMQAFGAALPAAELRALESSEAIQRVLDRFCLLGVHINPEMRVKVARGPARPLLELHRWRPFLVKVHNEAGTTSRLRATSAEVGQAWLDLLAAEGPPMTPTLRGEELEYRILRIRSHETGRREASLAFDVGQGTQDLGFRNEAPVLFDCRGGDSGNPR